MEEALQVLKILRDLLSRYGKADIVSMLDRLLSTDDSRDFWRNLSGLQFWGGAGAVWEVEPFQFSHREAATAGEDYRQFQGLMVELADILEAKGMSALASPTASLFRRQLEEGS